MPWIAKASCWDEAHDGPYTGGHAGAMRIVSGHIWLLDLPTTSNPANLAAHRGILYRRVDGHPDNEVLAAAKSLAHAINEAEEMAAITGGEVDYDRFASPDGSDNVGKLLVGLELVKEWRPGDGDEDIFAHLRHLVPSPFLDAEDDIPFPLADSQPDG